MASCETDKFQGVEDFKETFTQYIHKVQKEEYGDNEKERNNLISDDSLCDHGVHFGVCT